MVQKHQRNVDDCYPRGENSGRAPVGSKMSALIYYINSRPAKLLKVSAYLEKKVPHDLERQSPLFNRITLEIVENIMHGCSNYFASFAPTVLRLLDAYTRAPPAQLADEELAAKLFLLWVDFCKMCKGVLPSIRESEFFEKLSVVFEAFLRLAGTDRSRSVMVMKALTTMEDFRLPFGEERVKILLGKIYEGYQAARSSTIPVQDYQMLFKGILEGASSAALPEIMKQLFDIFDGDGWSYQQVCALLLSLMVQAVPVQNLSVMLSTFFKRMERAADTATSLLVDAVAKLLISNRSPLGYSALELAGNLLKLLRRQKPQTDFISASSTAPTAKTIFSICQAFVAILKNANFMLQKFEIIEYLISKAFMTTIPAPTEAAFGRHLVPGSARSFSIATVTLDTTEEVHYKSIVWGILFSLAHEKPPSANLKLATVEVNLGLFEQLFLLASITDSHTSLNTLMLWRQLLGNGLSISNFAPGRSRAGLNQTGIYLIGKTRLVVSQVIRQFPTTIVHYAAALALLEVLLSECDLKNLVRTADLALWMQSLIIGNGDSVLEDDLLTVLLLIHRLFLELANILNLEKLQALAQRGIARIESRGVKADSADDVLNGSRRTSFLPSEGEIVLREFAVCRNEVFSIFQCASDEDLKSAASTLSAHPYNPQAEEAELLSVQSSGPVKERVPSILRPNPKPSRAATSLSISRLSRLTSELDESSITAPAYFQTESSANFLMPPLERSRSRTPVSADGSEVLEAEFGDLSLRMRERRKLEKQRGQSILFHRPSNKE